MYKNKIQMEFVLIFRLFSKLNEMFRWCSSFEWSWCALRGWAVCGWRRSDGRICSRQSWRRCPTWTEWLRKCTARWSRSTVAPPRTHTSRRWPHRSRSRRSKWCKMWWSGSAFASFSAECSWKWTQSRESARTDSCEWLCSRRTAIDQTWISMSSSPSHARRMRTVSFEKARHDWLTHFH